MSSPVTGATLIPGPGYTLQVGQVCSGKGLPDFSL